jgi:hypothetical protein
MRDAEEWILVGSLFLVALICLFSPGWEGLGGYLLASSVYTYFYEVRAT